MYPMDIESPMINTFGRESRGDLADPAAFAEPAAIPRIIAATTVK